MMNPVRRLKPLRASSTLYVMLLACMGCSGSADVAPVSGVILYGDQPLAGAGITTQPIAQGKENPGSGSFGKTDEQGRFTLELVTPAMPGAIIGEHRVMITPPETSAAQSAAPATKMIDGVEVFIDDPQTRRATPAGGNWPASFSDGSLRLVVPSAGVTDAKISIPR
jgi:hypothetical protein